MGWMDRMFGKKDQQGNVAFERSETSQGEMYSRANKEFARDREQGLSHLTEDIIAEKARAYKKLEDLESAQAMGDHGLEDEITAANDYATAYGNILLTLNQPGQDAKEKIGAAIMSLETQAKQWSPLAQMKAAETVERLRALQ